MITVGLGGVGSSTKLKLTSSISGSTSTTLSRSVSASPELPELLLSLSLATTPAELKEGFLFFLSLFPPPPVAVSSAKDSCEAIRERVSSSVVSLFRRSERADVGVVGVGLEEDFEGGEEVIDGSKWVDETDLIEGAFPLLIQNHVLISSRSHKLKLMTKVLTFQYSQTLCHYSQIPKKESLNR